MKNFKLWKETLRIGNKGESFIKWWAIETNRTYKKANEQQNKELGIDAWIEGVPTDVKNTLKIYLGKFSSKYNKFYARHPFRKDSQAVDYCILDINEIDEIYKISYRGPIDAYLAEKYFKDESSLQIAKELLADMSDKTIQVLKFSNADALLLTLKNKLKPLLKAKIYCDYDSFMGGDERSISLITYEDKLELDRRRTLKKFELDMNPELVEVDIEIDEEPED